MADKSSPIEAAPLAEHGAAVLPSVAVDTYGAEIRDSEGFVGDRASNTAFREILDKWRKRLKELDEDPLAGGDKPKNGKAKTKNGNGKKLSKRKLDKVLAAGDPKAAGLLVSVIEEFAQDFADVIRRFLKLKAWQGTEQIVIGGGFRSSRIGEVVIGRTEVLLKADEIDVSLVPIRHHPDEAGLIGVCHLAPAWVFTGHNGILAVDIGGSNIRAGIVETNLKSSEDLAKAVVWKSELWRHAEGKPSRKEAVEKLGDMLRELIRTAEKDKFGLAPFIGVGCPGLIEKDGAIRRGAQNLPGGNWDSKTFNLPQSIREAVPEIGGHATAVLLHNDAVVQGLSEIPFRREIKHWGVLTVGTGLGNARFTNRE
jgi:predicted NBD/HSP70 family sugar kinase